MFNLWMLLLALVLFPLPETTSRSARIIGGEETYPGEFPSVVFLRYTEQYPEMPDGICVGSIKNATQIITAAHCVNRISISNFVVVAGAHDVSEQEGTQQVKKVLKKTIHPDYYVWNGTTRNDIAILDIEPLVFTSCVQPIRLPPPQHQPSGFCTITGWGSTETESFSDKLLKAQVPVVEDEKCSQVYPQLFDSTIQVCAGQEEGGKDACTFDTGGPLLCNDLVVDGKNVEYIAGIVSWGYLCGVAKMPGVYTKVSRYIDWI